MFKRWNFHNIGPQRVQRASKYGVSKIRRTFDSIPAFHPINDTARISLYSVRKYLPGHLNPLTSKIYTVRNSFV